MKIDRKKIVNRCGYDQTDCMLLAKRLSKCPDEELVPELKKITVWNYGKCELGLWADVLDRLDAILENAVTKVGRWMLRLDTPGNEGLVDDVVTILEFTSHLIEHSIYRYLYGSWSHILALFGSSNLDVLLAVLGLSYNFSKRSNYFIRLDQTNKKMVLDRLVSIAETWGGAENGFGLAACCDPNHFPETAGNVYFEYRSEANNHPNSNQSTVHTREESDSLSDGSSNLPCPSGGKIILHALHRRNQSPSDIMEEILSQHNVQAHQQIALFSRIRLATYFANPTQRHKCIRARLQALSILSYTFEVDERQLYPSLLDELVEVLGLTDERYMGIKACALRTMTAIINSHRLGINWSSLVGSTGLSSYHGILPNLTRKWVQGLVDGSIEAPAGSTNQQFTTALLSFLYHLACYEENSGPANTQSTTLSSSGMLDIMMKLISWHTPHIDYLSYVTRAVRVTDQILLSISMSLQHVVNILVDRLNYEVDVVLESPSNKNATTSENSPALNTQRLGLMKSILNLLKRLCLDLEWAEVFHSVMDNNLPSVLRRIFLNGTTHFTPHLSLFAMETITNYLYTYPSRISAMQDKEITTDILRALTEQPLPQNRDFLVQLPTLLNTLALNSRGIESILSSDVIARYLHTLVTPEYLPTMKTKRVRDFVSQISYDLGCTSSQSLSNSLTASQMSNAIQELLRSHSELKPVVFKCVVSCLQHVISLGSVQPAVLVPDNNVSGQVSFASTPYLTSDSGCSVSGPTMLTNRTRSHTSHSSTTDARSRAIGSTESHNTIGTVEDHVMLSAGEEEEEEDYNSDVDDINQNRRANTDRTVVTSSSLTDPRPNDVSSCNQESLISTIVNVEGMSLPSHLFLSDYMLNMCKFIEKLLPFVSHTSEAICPHFVSQGGLQVLCDMLRIPGLPYDFPVSAACASMCKIFEDIANAINLVDVIKPLFQCLETSLNKLCPLHSSNFSLSSLLLKEYLTNEHDLLHELVVISSVICILVQIIDHLKVELRLSFANIWLAKNFLRTLGRLYLGVSWEAAIILKLLLGDNSISDMDMFVKPKSQFPRCQNLSNKQCASNPTTSSSSISEKDTASSATATTVECTPQFVLALHIFTLLKQFNHFSPDSSDGFIHRHPELVRPMHRILHVTAFLINSVTQLCTAVGRFFTNRNPVSNRRRRTSLFSNEVIPNDAKFRALAQVSDVLSDAYGWEPSVLCRKHKSAPILIYAIRYASIRLTNLLLHDTNQKVSDIGMMTTFYKLNGVTPFFGLFRQLISFDLDDPTVREPLSFVMEEWLVCADRMSNVNLLASGNNNNSANNGNNSSNNNNNNSSSDTRRPQENDLSNVNVEKFIERAHQCMLFPLSQICSRTDLQNLLSRRAVEHLLSMLVTIVPCVFNTKGALSTTTTNPTTCTEVSASNVQTPTEQPDCPMSETPPPPPPIQTTTSTENITNPNELDSNQPADAWLSSDSDQLSTGDINIRDQSAVDLLAEMGFPRDLCIVALEQTDWVPNNAVNLLVAMSSSDIISNVNSRLFGAFRRGRTSRRAQRHRFTISNVGVAPATASDNEQLTGLDSNVENQTEVANMSIVEEKSKSSSDANDNASATSTISKPSCSNMEPCSTQEINEFLESLKQNVFRTCYVIAKRHHSDQILHQIAELFLSSGEEELYIHELFGVVTASLSSYLHLSCPSSLTIPKFDLTHADFCIAPTNTKSITTGNNDIKDNQTVGLHLLALLFTRCQSLCARLAWLHKLPFLLVHLISNSDGIRQKSSTRSITNDHLTASASSSSTSLVADQENVFNQSDYYKTLTLAVLILDQYERSIQAMRLRQTSVKSYSTSHNWHWFDDQAMLWHPYSNTSTRVIDNSYHTGELCSHCDINRRPYAVEFPTMTQVNLHSLHRRPILLFPAVDPNQTDQSGQSDANKLSVYEQSVLNMEIPDSLNREQCSLLTEALMSHFKTIVRKSATDSDTMVMKPYNAQSVLPADCVNAILRLILRLCFLNPENVDKIAEADFLSVLFHYPHAREFSSEFSAFLGALISEVFDDVQSMDRVMKDCLVKMSRYGVPSAYMGTNAGQLACRDLFYLCGVCAPLLAKDYQRTIKLATETFNLVLSEADIKNKVLPKTYTVEEYKNAADQSHKSSSTLSARQKQILVQLMEIILCPLSKPRKQSRFATTLGSLCLEDIDNDAYTTMATGAPTVSTAFSPASSTTTMTWTSGVTVGHSLNTNPRLDPQLPRDQPAFSNNQTVESHSELDKLNDYVFLGKLDAIRFLIDLVGSYKSVAEFVALYKHKSSTELNVQDKTSTDHTKPQSFLSYLFSVQLSDPETNEATLSLLEALILVSCDSIQGIMIYEFKASLSRMTFKYSSTNTNELPVCGAEFVQPTKNERIICHMRFLDRLLALPSPLINHLVRLLYKRRMTGAISKLFAVVDCSLTNAQSTMSVMLRTLENLTLVDHQQLKVNSTHSQRAAQLDSHVTQSSQVVNTESVHTTLQQSVNRDTTSTSRSNNRHIFDSGTHVTSANLISGTSVSQPSSVHGFDSDSDDDDDDDEDNDVTMLDQQDYNQGSNSTYNRSNLVLSSTQDAISTPSLSRVLDDVVISQDRRTENVRDSWHSLSEQEASSLIFVYDDEDEGSFGQGGDVENSEEVDDVMGEEEDDQDEGRDDDDEDDDDDDDDEDGEDDDHDQDDDGDDDVDISGEDEEVAFVINSGHRTGRIRVSSPVHRGTDASITISVSANGRSQPVSVHGEGAEIVSHVEEEGSIGDADDGDAFDRDEDENERSDIALIASDSDGVLIRPESRVLRSTNTMVAMVDGPLNIGVSSQLNTRGSNSRRDQFSLFTSDFGTNNLSGFNMVQSAATSGNWDIFLPHYVNLHGNDNNHLRNGTAHQNMPTSAAVLRFGSVGNTVPQLFVASGSSGRLGSSNINIVPSANSVGSNAAPQSQAFPSITIANQHPLLQIPPTMTSALSSGTNMNSMLSNYPLSNTNTNGLRVNRTNTSSSAFGNITNRVTVLPPIQQQHLTSITSLLHNARGRVAHMYQNHPLTDPNNNNNRHLGALTRLYNAISSEYALENTTNSTAGVSMNQTFHLTNAVNGARDNRSGPEADAFVWNMLASFANDQPSLVNVALAAAIFNRLSGVQSGTGQTYTDTGHRTFGPLQLTQYAGYALPPHYRRWLNLSRMLFGHEIMDLILLGRYQIFKVLELRRRTKFEESTAKSENLALPESVDDVNVCAMESQQSEEQVPLAVTAPLTTTSTITAPVLVTPIVSTSATSEEQTMEQPQSSLGTANDNFVTLATSESDITTCVQTHPITSEDASSTQSANMVTSEPQVDESSNTAATNEVTVSSSDSLSNTTTTTDTATTQAIATVSTTSPRPVPLTDAETIQSLVEGGMDPSFLDALPDDMRREVIADHRYARLVQQQLSSINLPEHINSDWLAGLPPHIQEEVLAQFRQEMQQRETATTANTNTTTNETTQRTEDSNTTEEQAQAPSEQNTPESNAAFLVSLPPSVLREVLADMEESQFDTLPPNLVVEARQLRRENVERFAREFQSGYISYSSDMRPDHWWQNLPTASGLIGGHGRWDVRFNSINQFLRQITSLDGSLNFTGPTNSVRQFSNLRGRCLVDYEGLTCLIVLLIASASCTHFRRNNIPNLRRVLRNLSCHSATRNWIINTLLSLFTGLSEKSVPHLMNTTGGEILDPSTKPSTNEQSSAQTSSNQNVLAPTCSEPQCPSASSSSSSSTSFSKPLVSNTIFHTGFEAALGCWVRTFHPLSTNPTNTPCQPGNNEKKERSVTITHTHNTIQTTYIIHPQAAVSVAVVLLETLNELSRAFPSHFYPADYCKQKGATATSTVTATTSSTSNNPETKLVTAEKALHSQNQSMTNSFWDLFNRLSQSITAISLGGSASVGSTSGRIPAKRARTSAHKRAITTTDKHHGFVSTHTTDVEMSAADPAHTSAHSKQSDQSSSKKELPTSSTAVVINQSQQSDCFTQLANLICHQLVRDRPVNQGLLLGTLCGIVKDFLLTRANVSSSDTKSSSQRTNTSNAVSTVEASQPQNESANVPVAENSKSSTTNNPSENISNQDIMHPLSQDVIETLCQFVLAQKSTETACIVATQLIVDLAKANHQTKSLILKLLCESTSQLISVVHNQLKTLIKEIDQQIDNKLLPTTSSKLSTTYKSSTSNYPGNQTRFSSYDVLPDRFGSPGQMVIVSSDARPIATSKLTDLQLNSAEVFTCTNSEQCRLRGVLGLILRIVAGDSSFNGSNPFPPSSQDPFHCIAGFSEFWSELSYAFEKIQCLNDSSAVLLVQPLLEAFCLSHIHLVKDHLLLRHRPSSVRSNRNSTYPPSNLSYMDMVPILHMSVEPQNVPEREGVSASTTEHLAHLHFDLGDPVSPPCLTSDGEKQSEAAVVSSRTSVASSTSSWNPILQFAEKHRRGLSQVLRQLSSTMGESPFAVFLAYPRVLDFDIKRRFFRQQLQSLSSRSVSSRYDDGSITVSRDRIFEDSYARLHRKSPTEWKQKFVIRFQNEEGQDAGGPLREWYLLMSREIFNPNYCLFRVSPADRVTYTINPSSYINSNHLSYFKFVGRFIAKAINDNKLLECYFTRAFYKHILGVPVKCSDLESEDYEFFKGLEFLLDNKVSDLGYDITFSTEINEFGKTETRDLIENGRHVYVTEHNKREYVRLVCQERMTGAIRQQLDAFLSGFYDIIPKRMISIFNEQELELLISGLPSIDIADLKTNTTYSKYQASSPQIEWFWQALESFEQEDLARFLQFVTGTSKVPLGGFANLEGMHGPTKFQITKAAISSTSHLPSAHTCFNTLVLPAYESYDQLRSRLLLAVRECSEGYGMA